MTVRNNNRWRTKTCTIERTEETKQRAIQNKNKEQYNRKKNGNNNSWRTNSYTTKGTKEVSTKQGKEGEEEQQLADKEKYEKGDNEGKEQQRLKNKEEKTTKVKNKNSWTTKSNMLLPADRVIGQFRERSVLLQTEFELEG